MSSGLSTDLFIRDELYLVLGAVNAITCALYRYHVRLVVGSRDVDLGCRLQFQQIQFLALWTQHETVMFLRYVQCRVCLYMYVVLSVYYNSVQCQSAKVLNSYTSINVKNLSV